MTHSSWRSSWHSSLRGAVAISVLLLVIGCGATTTLVQQATPKPTIAPTATPQPTTCAQVQGLGGAQALNQANMAFPAGTVAAAPSTAFGGAGQYTVSTYSACTPNNTADLTVATGKGPESFTKLVLFYGWAPWTMFPTGGDAQLTCAGTCFAFNADDVTKGIFSGPPKFLAVENVTAIANGLVTWKLVLATPPAAPNCTSSNFNNTEYQLYYDPTAGIQFPPLTKQVGDSAPALVGSDQCSAGSAATVKAFMDNQFSTHGYSSVTCSGDCWKNATTTVTIQLSDPTDWLISMPRVLP
ncbi:MAG TPA: hypothetical protein VGN32_10760 [Ktedonobacterales bacterium]|nr:hypothetical protein [Ktedonobacterales bacterium]